MHAAAFLLAAVVSTQQLLTSTVESPCMVVDVKQNVMPACMVSLAHADAVSPAVHNTSTAVDLMLSQTLPYLSDCSKVGVFM